MAMIFNTAFEMKLRIILLLSQTKQALSMEEIVDYDFITIYSKDFGIGSENLHGDNDFKYSEFASRQELAWLAIKELVVEGTITVMTDKGFYYKISDQGLKYANSLESAYSIQYRETARQVLQKYAGCSENEVSNVINAKAIQSVRRKR